jgi:hypothetical protein
MQIKASKCREPPSIGVPKVINIKDGAREGTYIIYIYIFSKYKY